MLLPTFMQYVSAVTNVWR